MFTQKIYSKWMAETQRAKIKNILKHVKISRPVLDVGCGPGFLEEKIKTIAVDVNLADLKKFKGKRILATGDALPFADETFKTIFCIDTIHLLKKPEELVRVLAQEGLLIVSLPCNNWNYKQKLCELKKKFPKIHIEKDFIVKTEREWDAVVVFSKPALLRRGQERQLRQSLL